MPGSIRCLCAVAPLCCCATLAFAQDTPSAAVQARNSAYLEAAGNGGMASINYDRAVAPGVALRLGWGNWESDHSTDFDKTTKSYNVFPVMLSALLYSGEHHLELGGGMLVGRASVDSSAIFVGTQSHSQSIANLEALVGYRRQVPTGGFLFRAGVTPSYALSGDYPSSGLHLGGGVSIGWAF